MSRESCLLALNEEGLTVNVKLSKAVADRIEASIEAARAKGVDVPSAVEADMAEFAVEAQDLKKAVERNVALNFEARLTMKNYIDTHWADDPAEGMRTLLTGVQIDRPGAKDAVSVLQAQIFDNYFGGMTSRLHVPVDGVKPIEHVRPLGWLKKKNPDEDAVRTIMYHMDQPDADPALWKDKSPSMVKAAEVLLDVQETMRKDANAVGSHFTPKLANHTSRRSYDGPRMREAGPDEFIADMEKWMDMEKTDVPQEALPDVLLRHYNQEVSGERVMNPTAKPESDSVPAGMGNVSKAMAERRIFHFKDVDAEIEFANKYGRGQLLESIAFNLELGAQRIGLMKKLGPNAQANYDKVAQEVGYAMSKEKGSAKALTNFETKMRKTKRSHWPMVDGSMFVPESHTFAKGAQTYRAVKMWAQLGSAVLSAFADIPIYASRVNYSGGSYIGGIFEGIGTTFKSITPARMELAAELGVIADNMRNTAMSRFDVDSMIPGGSSRITEKFFNLNLLTPWTDRLRVGFVQARSHTLATYRGKSFDNLPEGVQREFRQFNITDAEWNVLRAGAEKNVDGRQYLTPESVGDLDDSIISTYLGAIGKADNKSNHAKYRAEITDRMRSMFNQSANQASLVPDAATRATMLMGTRAGTIPGEAIRSVGMYKSFPIAIVRQIMGSEVYGRSSNLATVGGAFETGAMMRMSRMVVMSTMFGALAMSMKEIVAGKEPSLMTTDDMTRTMTRALLQGGAMGLYGDFLLGETKNRYGGNLTTTLLGPLASDINSVADIYGKLKEGDADKAGADTLKQLFRNVPGNNLFYTKMAYDFLIMNNLAELGDPGSLRRMEQKKRKETNQQYFMLPSQNNLVN